MLKPDEQSRDKVQVETYADIVKKSPSEEKINEKEYNCMGCSFQGTEESELRRHVHIKHTNTSNGNNQDDCSICGHRFTSRRDLDKHKKNNHVGGITIKCKRCEETFGSNDELNTHIQSEYVEHEARKLRSCDDEFISRAGVKKHDNTKYSNEDGIYCRICGEQFIIKRRLGEHRKKEHIESVAHCRNNLEGQCPYTD